MVWEGWPLSRVLMLFVGAAFLMIATQVALFHYRQNFHHWAQWTPVIGAPAIGLVALLTAIFNATWLNWVLIALLGVGLLVGVVGFALHFTGVGERVDGYRFNNFLVGPPIVLPLMVTAMSVLGLLVILWR